jgi:hypothetical protein
LSDPIFKLCVTEDAPFGGVFQALFDLKAEIEIFHDIRLGGVSRQAFDQLDDLVSAHDLNLLFRMAKDEVASVKAAGAMGNTDWAGLVLFGLGIFKQAA